MRVLFTVWPSRSHLYPMVPLGWAFQAAGHDVRFATMPSLTGAVTRAGLAAVSVGADADLLTMSKSGTLAAWHHQQRWPADWPMRMPTLDVAQRELLDGLGAKSARTSGLMAGDLLEFARRWRPDLVVYDAVSFSGKLTGDALGVPTVAHLWGQAGVHRNELLAADGSPHPDFVRLYERFGVPLRTDPTVWLDPCPPSLRMPAAIERTSVRYVPYNGTGQVPDWLREPPRRPRVCVTWGLTSPALHGPALPELILGMIRRIADLGVEVVVAAPVSRDRLGELPESIRTVELLPLHLLLPTCQAIVHQGGAGTSMTSTWYGVPHLIVSMRPEHMATGARIAEVGAGRHRVYNELADRPEEGSALLGDDVAMLLGDPSYGEAAARLRSDMHAQPAPTALVERLARPAAGAVTPAMA